MTTDPYRYFRAEAREIVERIGQGVLELEKGTPAADLVASLFRLAHTLKGAARVVKQAGIADLAHAIEDKLAPLREKEQSLTREGINDILGSLDQVTSFVDQLDVITPERPPLPGPSGASDLRTPAELRTVRADVSELDGLLESMAEVSTRVGAIRRTTNILERSKHVAQLLAEHAASARQREPSLRPADRTTTLADELRGLLATLERDLTRGLDDLSRELRQAQAAAEQLRLFPAEALLAVLQRAARDAADHQGTPVELEIRGGDVRLDAHLLNTVQPALVQLVRNAVVHGIEASAERVRRGKRAVGKIAVVVSTTGKYATFSCEDDGRGVDVSAVRRVAEQRGVLPPGSPSITAEAVIDLLLKGGLTTADNVTQVSGRGVGLDIVRAAAERLGGSVRVRGTGGTGTAIEMRIPVSLSSVDALLLESGDTIAAIPIASVQSSMRVFRHDLTRAGSGLAVAHEGRIVPFAPLSRLFGGNEAFDPGRAWSAVIVESGSGLAAVGASRLMPAETMLVRPLPPGTPRVPIILGAAIDAGGTPQLVLDPDEIVRAVAKASAIRQPPARERLAPMLIVDDSMTTRMLEQSILESAGFDVEAAASAEEALEMAGRNRYSLFLVDVEMPGMDGFTFVERTRADPALQNVPAILVTSREAPSDRRRGEQTGASAYIVKSEFDQAELLRIIRGLVIDGPDSVTHHPERGGRANGSEGSPVTLTEILPSGSRGGSAK
jgi:two-component system chemotaxis sensor kinase CheA